MTICFSAASHLGHERKTNEDRYFAQRQDDGSLLLAVADGMGGAPGGARAASLAIGAFAATGKKIRLSPPQLARLAMAGHEAITATVAADTRLKGMGTTLTAALVQEDQLCWIHIGDSRLYRLHNRQLRQLTSDHRFIRRYLKGVAPSPEELRSHPLAHILEQCLGGPRIELESGTERFLPGDRLLLCTDGLHDELSPETLESLLAKDDNTPEKVRMLMEAALKTGARDNITLIVAESGPCQKD